MIGRKHLGFTLIELLVVIAIIAILAAILFPVFTRAKDKAKQAACLSNEKQIGAGVDMYCSDNANRIPLAQTFGKRWSGTQYARETRTDNKYLPQLIYPYIKNRKIFMCPSVGATENMKELGSGFTPRSNGDVTYLWNHVSVLTYTDSGTRLISGRLRSDAKRLTTAPLLWDIPYWGGTARHGGGINVLYGDCHAGWVLLHPDMDYYKNGNGTSEVKGSAQGWDIN